MSSKFLNLDTDNTLGGVNTSDSRVASQKAVKDYVDTNVPTVTSVYTADGTDAVNGVAVSNAIATKQDILVSGTSIKTLNGNSLLGSGNIVIEASSTPDVDGDTISYNTDNELQTIGVINQRDGSALKIWHGTQAQWNQGESIPWYYWSAIVGNTWVGASSSINEGGSVAYGNGVFVNIVKNEWSSSSICAYSTDGITWSSGNNLPSGRWSSVAYGGGKFVAVAVGSLTAYSTDGINWQQGGGLSSAFWRNIVYGGDRFVALSANGDVSAYSTDGGVNWTIINLPSFASGSTWSSLGYGDGKFVACSKKVMYSTDGINWLEGTKSTETGGWSSIAYGEGKFVAVNIDYKLIAYSSDGINWTENSVSSYGASISYGNDKFMFVPYNGNKAFYSTDGTNWSESTLPYSAYWTGIAYGEDKFVAGSDNGYIAYFDMSAPSCFTDTATPTTTSAIYSAPDTASALTVSSVTSGAITLSDNNTYYYNQSGNQYTYSTVGEAHSDWLCFIDGVGIKIGTTTIANNLAVTVDQTYNASSTNAQSGVAVASGISDTLGTINTSLESIIAQGD